MRPRELTPRATEIVAAAAELLESEGPAAMTMRRVADELGIRAPSLYKHLPGKGSLEALVVEVGMVAAGTALHAALDAAGDRSPVDALLIAYRREARAHPNMYRLMTAGTYPRSELSPGLDEWAGNPFFRATGEPYLAQALWAFAHGAAILELDGRLADAATSDRMWAEGARTFAAALRSSDAS